MTVGFVGAGRMGRPMITRLVQGGLPVRVFVRSQEAAGAVAAEAEPMWDLASVGRGADAVVVCVHTDEQVRDVCSEDGLLSSMSEGSVLIVHTTGSPYTVQDVEQAASLRGVGVVDAPVSGGPHDIARGNITTFVGGDADHVANARSVLRHYSDPILEVGVLGCGQLTKLVNNSIFASNVAILDAATHIGIELGLDEGTLIRCLARGSARSAALEGVSRAGSSEAFTRSVGEFLGKDIAVVRGVANDLGVDLGIVGSILSDRAPVR